MPAGEPAEAVAEANLTEEPPDQGNQPEWADVIAEEKAYTGNENSRSGSRRMLWRKSI